jgi:lipopolysaccharide biosynthesis protein
MKTICFYLPQYHPTPYNDEWWGKGFTEWTKVAQARPRFRGHHQPQIPADLGFYDLRLEETRIAQAELAREYGIYGFCYYHYWFNGTVLLDRPLKEVRESGSPDFPFCICWANENWTRAWEAHEQGILMHQEYNPIDRKEHIKWLCQYFKDPRYIRIGNKPLLLIYRPDHMTDTQDRLADWREYAKQDGFEDLYICFVRNYRNENPEHLIQLGFDAQVEHQPSEGDLPERSAMSLLRYARNKLINNVIEAVGLENRVPLLYENRVFNYRKLASNVMNKPHPTNYRLYPCVTPTWDNSARKRRADIIQNDDPEVYAAWLRSACNKVSSYPKDEQIVFINAWNEWAEGCHLEPDLRNGRSFLEATHNVMQEFA